MNFSRLNYLQARYNIPSEFTLKEFPEHFLGNITFEADHIILYEEYLKADLGLPLDSFVKVVLLDTNISIA